MNRALCAVVVALIVSTSVSASEGLYRVNSKDVGWTNIDLTVTETKREPRVSRVSIPHYRNRTSVESRFAMCAFTDMAIQRKFAAWVVSDIGNDEVLVGFPTSEDEDVLRTLGPRFAQPDLLKASVHVINRMCGITIK